MANNAFNFKGIYDKIAGLLKTSDIQDTYTPVDTDYVAIYKNVPGSNVIGDNTIAMKEYVPVTEIGTGGGGGGGGTMSSFNVASTGGVTISKNSSAYGEGPFTIENLDEFSISATTVPSGLNWRGSFSAPSAGATFEINDVVYTTTGSPVVYRTWFAIQQQNVSGAVAPPTGTEYSNDYWALLGTQGPPGDQGPAGLPSATATFGFKPFSQAGGTYTSINVSGTPGSGLNDVGKIFLANNTSTTNPLTELVFTINANLSGGDPTVSGAGWPYNSQITVMNVSVENSTTGMPPVKIVGAEGVTINSADGAQYLRTQYSTCSIVRRSANEYYMFGDLTNIA